MISPEFDLPGGTVVKVRARKPIRQGRYVAVRKGQVTTATVNTRDQYATTLRCNPTVAGMGIVYSVVYWDLELVELVSKP